MPSSLSGVRDLIMPILKERCDALGVVCDCAVQFHTDNLIIGFWRADRSAMGYISRKAIDDLDFVNELARIMEEAFIELGVKQRPGAFDGAAEYEEIFQAQEIMDDLTQQKP